MTGNDARRDRTLRPVRSFVLRQGRMSPAQSRALDDAAAALRHRLRAAPLDFARVFGRRAPVVLEIGFGMGETTAAIAARAAASVDFLGVEVHAPGRGRAARSASTRTGSANVRVDPPRRGRSRRRT